MSLTLYAFFILMLPFIGTFSGALSAFFVRGDFGEKKEDFIGGFASGIMSASAIFSLLIPSLEISSFAGISGFALGMLLPLLFDRIFSKNEDCISKKSLILFLVVTLHNIPEGMAVGVALAGSFAGKLSLEEVFMLTLGIAIQNIPEGAIVSVPMMKNNKSRKEAMNYGIISGVVEPLFGFITLIVTRTFTAILPYILSFASGAMMYVVFAELVPESLKGENNSVGTLGVMSGFVLMMSLDVLL